MVLVVVLHTFGNRIEGRRVHKGEVRDLGEHRVRALTNATPGRPLVRELTPDEKERWRQQGTLDGPQAKVEPDSNQRRRSPRRAPMPEGTSPEAAEDPRRETKLRTKAPTRVRKRGAQAKEPEAPRPLARGSQTGAATASSSSQAGPALDTSIMRPRGTRTPKQGGSRSTTPTN